MDPITHGLLGATVGQLGFRKPLGKKAVIWGALAAMTPDLDVLVKFGRDPFAEFLYHRGITHSLWFGPVVGTLLAFIIHKFYQKKYPPNAGSLSSWIGLISLTMLSHPLLDVFVTYGTQLLAPFSNYRFSIGAVPVVDPIYSLILAIGLVLGLMSSRVAFAQVMSGGALLLTTMYIFWGLMQNEKAVDYARTQLAAEGIAATEVNAYSTLFQLFLRRVVVHTPTETRIGFVSTWAPKKIMWTTLPIVEHPALPAFHEHRHTKIFKWFTSNEYLIKLNHALDKIQLFDTRFGIPGETIYGIWGVESSVDKAGEFPSEPEFFRIKVLPSLITVQSIFKAAFTGDIAHVYSLIQNHHKIAQESTHG